MTSMMLSYVALQVKIIYNDALLISVDVPKYNELLAKVPPSHQVVCEMLLYFLSRVLNHKAKNTLEFENLAG
jgi:hypothetical protein